MYGKLKDGEIQYAPVNYVTADNKLIFNFNTNEEAMKENGFKPVINTPPAYDADLYTISIAGYTDDTDSITVNYKLNPKSLSEDEQYELAKKKVMQMVANTFTDAQAIEVKLIFPQWMVGCAYVVGDKVQYENKLWKCLSAHTSIAEWYPSQSYLWSEILNQTIDGEIPDWKQPDYTNPYMKGDKVKFEGKIYESLIDNNSWSPKDYPAGWKEVTE